jgi:PmbA protein
MDELKQEPYLMTAAFSDFTVDTLTGDFCGEIRLAWYYDGKTTVPVTGGSVTGNITELQNEMYLSKERQKDNNFEGPAMVMLKNVTVAGIE